MLKWANMHSMYCFAVPQSILDRFGCSRARFEGNYIYYQMTGHDQLQFWSVMTSCSHSHGFLESAVIWLVAVMADLGKWPDLTWPVNTRFEYLSLVFCTSNPWVCQVISLPIVATFIYSEPWWHLFYSLLWPDYSQLITYDILTVLSVSLAADFPFTDYFSHNYSFWLITYNTLSQIDLVCVPDPLVYKPSVQTVFL